ncbi:hypothetical protein D3C72_2237400 [compost metagenome]
MSAGLRLVIRLPSTTTSASRQRAPALARSCCSDGHEVTSCPFASPLLISSQGPWQIAATGLPASAMLRMKSSTASLVRRVSGLITPPGSTSASKWPASAPSSD